MWSELFALVVHRSYGITADPLPEDVDGVRSNGKFGAGLCFCGSWSQQFFSYWIWPLRHCQRCWLVDAISTVVPIPKSKKWTAELETVVVVLNYFLALPS